MTPQELMHRINNLEEDVQVLVAKFQSETGTRVDSFRVESRPAQEMGEVRAKYIPEEVIALVQI